MSKALKYKAPEWFLSPSQLVGDDAGWNPEEHVDKEEGRSPSIKDCFFIELREAFSSLFTDIDTLTDDELIHRAVELMRDPGDTGFDIHKIVVDTYFKHLAEGVTRNFDCMSSYEDCIKGRDVVIRQGKKMMRRNGHQTCIKTEAINLLVEYFNDNDPIKEIDSFESLVNQLREINETVKAGYFAERERRLAAGEVLEKVKWNYSSLCIYDLALRLVWHHPERERLLPKTIHIYRGPLLGAQSLWSISHILRDIEKLEDNGFLDSRIGRMSEIPEYGVLDRSELPAAYLSIDFFHLEIILCDFYWLYEWVEIILRRENNLVERGRYRSLKDSLKRKED